MPIQSRATGSQNNDDPQIEQNPRRAFSDDWNQLTLSSPRMVTADFGTSVDAKKCPECFRQLLQWQASGGGKSPATSKVTAPHKQDPLCMSPRPQFLGSAPLPFSAMPATG